MFLSVLVHYLSDKPTSPADPRTTQPIHHKTRLQRSWTFHSAQKSVSMTNIIVLQALLS